MQLDGNQYPSNRAYYNRKCKLQNIWFPSLRNIYITACAYIHYTIIDIPAKNHECGAL